MHNKHTKLNYRNTTIFREIYCLEILETCMMITNYIIDLLGKYTFIGGNKIDRIYGKMENNLSITVREEIVI